MVDANANTNVALFKALKGGTSNFGVVTRFDMRAFQQGKFWGGFIGQDISTRFQQFQYFEDFAMSKNYDPYSAFINNYSFTKVPGWTIARYESLLKKSFDLTWPLSNLPQRLRVHETGSLSRHFQKLHRSASDIQHNAHLQSDRFHHRDRCA